MGLAERSDSRMAQLDPPGDTRAHHRAAKGDAGVRTLGCADLFRVMALAQLTWRESLRDIEACLVANQAKQFHMGLRAPRARSALSDALTQRDRRIYHALAFEVAPLSPGGALAVSKTLRRLYWSKGATR